jgi:hypothetical protein
MENGTWLSQKIARSVCESGGNQMIDDPQKADGQWLYLNFHCQSNTPVAHLILITHLAINRNIPLAQDRSLPASSQQEVETAAVKWLTTVTAGLPRTKPAVH